MPLLGGRIARSAAAAAVGVLLVATMQAAGPPAGLVANNNVTPPVRATFYYPWFPEVWHSTDQYVAARGRYDSGAADVLAAHVASMKYAGLDAAISSWWGRGHPTDRRLPRLLEAAQAGGLRVTAYYEPKGKDSTTAQLAADLARLDSLATRYRSWLRIEGRPVLFVYDTSGCADVDRWQRAASGWYLNLKVFPGYRSCAGQPDSWHQYAPAMPVVAHLPHAFGVSPGFWKYGEPRPRLARDLDRFRADVSRMVDSGATWQLVTSFNEWGEGTAIESGGQWRSASGHGQYVDALFETLVAGKRYRAPPSSAAPTPSSTPTPDRTATPRPTSDETVTVAAAGDVACQAGRRAHTEHCAHGAVAATMAALDPDAVLGLGDLQYQKGELANFKRSYHPTWGRFYDRTYPAPGNHEWLTPGAQGYRDYFRRRLEDIGVGDTMYYSFDLGAWHFISLDSDCSKVGGCGKGDPMVNWLRADLAAHDGRPTLVYHHHPRWSSGRHGSEHRLAALNAVLVADRDVTIVLAGHDHFYERFGPMGVSGPQRGGVRYFVVGTGGSNHTCGTGARVPGSEVVSCDAFGVLRLTLRPDGYDWRFVSTGSSFSDSGVSRLR